MDFEVVGFGGAGLASSDSTTLSFSPFSSSPNKHKLFGSTSLKQESTLPNSEDGWKDFKAAKTCDYLSSAKEMRYSSESHQQQQMLSFSDPNSTMASFPHYTSSSVHSRIPGYGSEGLNGGGMMHGMVPGMKGPFTSSQWMELEHQALIYKYITSNIQIPPPLLFPIQKAIDSAALSHYRGLRYNTLGWGGYNLGFSSSTDPEPGRCRRTDGKKWRCAKDAVANHKYCERHMNRGRHRSRKLVEAGNQSGNSVSSNADGTSKLPLASTNAAAEPGRNSASNSFSFMNQQVSNLQPGGTNLSAASHLGSLEDETKVNVRVQDTGNVSRQPSIMNLKQQYSTTEHQNPIEGTSRSDFGLIFSDSVLNPLNKNASQIYRNNVAMKACNDGNNNKSQQHSLHLFRDDWSRNRPESSISDRTELSISTPKTPSDYMSTTSSPTNDKFGTFPLRLLPEVEATQMGLGIGTVDEPIPSSWRTPVGGPLGEALHITTNNGNSDNKRSSALNLMGGWDSNNPSVASSPTGVLQKAAFGSVSNSSARSSPESSRGGSICFSGLFGSTQLNSVFPGL